MSVPHWLYNVSMYVGERLLKYSLKNQLFEDSQNSEFWDSIHFYLVQTILFYYAASNS